MAYRTSMPAPRLRPADAGPWSMRPDEELLVEYRETGTGEAFEELVHRYERELFGYLRRYLGSAHSAEDAFQAAFLQVHLRCREFDASRRFRPWLYRMATTRAIDLLRKDRRWNKVKLQDWGGRIPLSGHRALRLRDLPDARAARPEEELVAAEQRESTRRMVEGLPARLNAVAVPVMLQGLPYRQVADQLGIPLGTVKSRLHEAVVRLRTLLGAGRAA